MMYYVYCDGEVEVFTEAGDAHERVDELKEYGVDIYVLSPLTHIDGTGKHHITPLGKLSVEHYWEIMDG